MKKITTARLWNAKDDTFRDVPIDGQFNGGQALGFYLGKRDDASGKPIFYTEAHRRGMSDEAVQIARDFKPLPTEAAPAGGLVQQALRASPEEIEALRKILNPTQAPVVAGDAKRVR